ncbi:hypothetical protein AURDEDRAFT_179685 [Auricularia subglabra TFB-10046 SS5]|nr:hypothetical protein AURDEDRAFT_179685 [Auricularia subglabra TFB-10046 SS5]
MLTDERECAEKALIDTLRSPGVRVAQGAYFTLVISGGLVLLPLVLVTFAVSNVPARNAALVNFLLGMVIYSLGNALLPLSGHLQDPVPPRGICFLQLQLMHGGPIMGSVAAVMIVVHLAVHMPGSQRNARPIPKALRMALAVIPPAVFVVYVIVDSLVSILLGDRLVFENSALSCRHSDRTPFFLKQVQLVVMLIAMVIGIIASTALVVRIKRTLKLVGLGDWRQHMRDSSERAIWLTLLVRFGLFMLFCLVGVFIQVILFAVMPGRPVRFVVIGVSGLAPLIVFLIFGTVRSLRTTWHSWIFRVPPPTPEKPAYVTGA